MPILRRTPDGYEYYELTPEEQRLQDLAVEGPIVADAPLQNVYETQPSPQPSSWAESIAAGAGGAVPYAQPQPEAALLRSLSDTEQPVQLPRIAFPPPVPPFPERTQLEELPRPEPEGWTGYINRHMEPTTRAAAGLLSLPGTMLYGLGGGLAEISDLAESVSRDKRIPKAGRLLATPLGVPSMIAQGLGYPDWSKRIASLMQVNEKGINTILDLPEEMGSLNFFGYGPSKAPAFTGHYIGKNIVPLKQFTAPVSMALSAWQAIVEQYIRPPEPVKPTNNLLHVAQEQAKRVDDANKMAAAAGYEPPVEINPATGKAKRKSKSRPDVTGREAPPITPIETPGGPTVVKTSDFTALGYMTAATLGMIFLPGAISKLRTQGLPSLRQLFGYPAPQVLRPAPGAGPGTMAASTPGDFLATTTYDFSLGPLQLANRVGVSPYVVRNLQDTFHTHSFAAAHSMGDSAVRYGMASTPNFTFRTRTPIARVAQFDSPEFTRYALLWDTADEITMAATAQAAAQARRPSAPPMGPPMYRGMDINTVMAEIRRMDQANPQLRVTHREYIQNMVDLRTSESMGIYGTMSRQERIDLNTTNRHHVPTQKRNPEQLTGDEVAATASMDIHIRDRIRYRLENEAIGRYIDAVRAETGDTIFRTISPGRARSPLYRDQHVSFMRRGEREYYAAEKFLVDALNFDPFHPASSAAHLWWKTKRGVEIGSTGMLAPWFPPINMARSYLIGKLTIDSQFTTPSMLGTLAAIPRQLGPQMARSVHNSLEGGGFEAAMRHAGFSQQSIQTFSRKMADVYINSLYAQLQSVGSHRGSVMQQHLNAHRQLSQAAQDVRHPWGRNMLNGYRSLMHAINDSVGFDFAHKNYGQIPIDKLALEARRITGDTRVSGRYRIGERGREMRFDIDPTSTIRGREGTAGGARALGWVSEDVGRTATPWFNAMSRGMGRIGEAYLADPAAFTTKVWTYTVLPSASIYAYTRALGNDPDGMSYIEYAREYRSETRKAMNFYIPIPGLPANKGVEFPRYHEMIFGNMGTEMMMDHMYRSNVYPLSEDFAQIAKNFGGMVMMPAAPPIFNAALASQGMTGVQGMFGGGSYRMRENPFDHNTGLPAQAELFLRSFVGGVAEIIGAGAAAWVRTSPEDKHEAAANAARAMGRRVVQKTPFVSNILDELPPIAGSTPTQQWMFEHRREVRQLLDHYKATRLGEGGVVSKPRSPAGGVVLEETLRNQGLPYPLPGKLAGLPQEPAKNPLYERFIAELDDRFNKDSPNSGGIGLLSMFDHYALITKNIRSLYKVDDGSKQGWQRYLESPAGAEQIEFLKSYGVNPTDIREVKNFYLVQRHKVAGIIRNTIQAVEQDISRKAMAEGLTKTPIKFKDLHPYKKQTEAPMLSTEEEAETY